MTKEFNPAHVPPNRVLRYSPKHFMPKGLRNYQYQGKVFYSFHAGHDRVQQRGLPVLRNFSSQELVLGLAIDRKRSCHSIHEGKLYNKVKPELVSVEATYDPDSRQDVLLRSAWRFPLIDKVYDTDDGEQFERRTDMTMVLDAKGKVVTAWLNDQADFTWEENLHFASEKQRQYLINQSLFEKRLNEKLGKETDLTKKLEGRRPPKHRGKHEVAGHKTSKTPEERSIDRQLPNKEIDKNLKNKGKKAHKQRQNEKNKRHFAGKPRKQNQGKRLRRHEIETDLGLH